MKSWGVLVVVVLAAGCGGGTPASVDQVTVNPTTASPTPVATPTPMFATPEAAMTFLADAYNRKDLVALKKVTNPVARDALEAMRSEATDLKLKECTFDENRRDYHCTFTHGYPVGYNGTSRHGTAGFTVGPADKPGWYMTVLEYCG